jgi:hypothetical protein
VTRLTLQCLGLLALQVAVCLALAFLFPGPWVGPSPELAQCKVERAVIAGEARELHGRLEARDAQDLRDRDAVRKALHQLSLYCPKVRG